MERISVKVKTRAGGGGISRRGAVKLMGLAAVSVWYAGLARGQASGRGASAAFLIPADKQLSAAS